MSTFKQEIELTGIDPQSRPDLLKSQVGGTLSNCFKVEDNASNGERYVIEIETLMDKICYRPGENVTCVWDEGYLDDCEIIEANELYAVVRSLDDDRVAVFEYRDIFKASDRAGALMRSTERMILCNARQEHGPQLKNEFASMHYSNLTREVFRNQN